MSTYTGVTNCQ